MEPIENTDAAYWELGLDTKPFGNTAQFDYRSRPSGGKKGVPGQNYAYRVPRSSTIRGKRYDEVTKSVSFVDDDNQQTVGSNKAASMRTGASKNRTKVKKTDSPRPAWNSTVSDQSKYKRTPDEEKLREQAYYGVSPVQPRTIGTGYTQHPPSQGTSSRRDAGANHHGLAFDVNGEIAGAAWTGPRGSKHGASARAHVVQLESSRRSFESRHERQQKLQRWTLDVDRHRAGDDITLQAVTSVMELASTSNAARHDIMKTVLPSALLRLVQCDHVEIAAAAAGALGNLMDGSKDIRGTFLQLGSADALVSVLHNVVAEGSTDHNGVAENVLAALRNFTIGSDRIRHAVIRAGLVPLLPWCLSHSAAAVAEEAAGTVKNLCAGGVPHAEALAADGAVPSALAHLLLAATPGVREQAESALLNMARTPVLAAVLDIVSKAKDEVVAVREEFDEVASAGAQDRALKAHVWDLERQIDALATQTQALEDKCVAALKEKESVEAQATIVETALADACTEIERLKASLAAAGQDIAEKTGTIATLQRQLSTTAESLTQQRVDVETRLRQELSTVHKENERVARMLNDQLMDTQRSLHRVQRREQETKAALRLSKPRSEWTEEERAATSKSSAKLRRKGTYTKQESPQPATPSMRPPHASSMVQDHDPVSTQRLPAKHKTVRQPVYAFGGSTPRGLGTRSHDTVPPKRVPPRKTLPSPKPSPSARRSDGHAAGGAGGGPASATAQPNARAQTAPQQHTTPRSGPACGRDHGVPAWSAAPYAHASPATATASVDGNRTFVDNGRPGNITVFDDAPNELGVDATQYSPPRPGDSLEHQDPLFDTLGFMPQVDGPSGRRTSTPRRTQDGWMKDENVEPFSIDFDADVSNDSFLRAEQAASADILDTEENGPSNVTSNADTSVVRPTRVPVVISDSPATPMLRPSSARDTSQLFITPDARRNSRITDFFNSTQQSPMEHQPATFG
eukprot:m.1512465 g.1512465  ORF g.1512465 m.1512465 type:complete len:973 (-) comp25213_c0_seq17:2929-5847(-)